MYAVTWTQASATRLAVDWTRTWRIPYIASRGADGSWHVGINLNKDAR